MDLLAPVLRRLCFLDIETTGLDPRADEVLEIGLVFVERGAITARRSWLVRPGRPVPPAITALTGLCDADVQGAPTLGELEVELRDALDGWTLVAHNGAFERAFLGNRLTSPLLDSCELALLLFPELPSHSLDSLLRVTGVGRGARHRALDDAEDTFLVLAALCERAVLTARGDALRALGRHLAAGTSRDRAALLDVVRGLEALVAARAGPPRDGRAWFPAEPASPVAALAAGAWLSAPRPLAIELDGPPPVLELVAAAAPRWVARGAGVAVAVSRATARRIALGAPVPVVPQTPVCSTWLALRLDEPAGDEPSQLGRAYLDAWLRRTPTGDLAALSPFLLERGGDAATLAAEAARCQCSAEGCLARREAPPGAAACVVVTHEQGLAWLERGAPVQLCFLEAEALAEAERRRVTRWLAPRHLEGADATAREELAQALARLGAREVTLEQRTRPAWLAVREALLTLSRTLPADGATRARLWAFVDPPPPGFRVFSREGALELSPGDPTGAIARRLRPGDCLVSRPAGLAWYPGATLRLTPTC